MDEVVAQLERKEEKKTDGGPKFCVTLLRQLLQHVWGGGYMNDAMAQECGTVLKAFGP